MDRIYVSESEIHGRGVFAGAPIAEGELIERCPVLRIGAEQRRLLDQTLLYEYYFEWDGDAGIAFGFGSVYNHSASPNAQYTKETDTDHLTLHALRAIEPGEEITMLYWPGPEL